MKRSNFILLFIAISLIILAVVITSTTQAANLGRIAALFLGVLGGLASLSEVLGLFEKLGVPEYILETTPKYIERQRVPFETSVAVWGPPNSGKTWLITAFSKSIDDYSNNNELDLKYQVETISESYNNFSLQGILGTSGMEPHKFRFTRKRTNESFRSAISSYTHNILVYDNRGQSTLDLINESTRILMANADIIFVILDLTMLTEVGGEITGVYTKKEYSDRVIHLFSMLEKADPKHKLFYAICITKIDMIHGGYNIHPDGLIEMYFGAEIGKVFQLLREAGRLELFSTSAAGFLKERGYVRPNYDFATGELLDFNIWKPYGVEFPFFWAFEKMERKLLSEMLTKSFWNKLTYNNKIKRYIPYPKPEYRI